MNTLTIKHLDGDCGNFTTGNTFDRYTVELGGQFAATLDMRSDELSGPTLTLVNATGNVIHKPKLLQQCMLALTTLLDTADCEFYCDALATLDDEALTVQVSSSDID